MSVNADLPLVTTEEAEAEAAGAFDWYKEKAGEEIAHGFRVALRSTIDRVRARPETYPKFEGNVRRCLFTHYPYAVLYEVTDGLRVTTKPPRCCRYQRWDASGRQPKPGCVGI